MSKRLIDKDKLTFLCSFLYHIYFILVFYILPNSKSTYIISIDPQPNVRQSNAKDPGVNIIKTEATGSRTKETRCKG